MTPRVFCTCRPGCTVWLTGPPSTGKSTLAEALAGQLRRQASRVQAPDGDNNRRLPTADLGLSRHHRPAAPDLRIQADRDSIDTCTATLHTLLKERSLA
ncbi:adenylyl-sulfate kinase [Streptomyces sp. NPDC056149]|uniref:adenylyl-sulfate kinase n=1 Tax=Streptomyces sp. NPDC056149 TaxID=3345728 RepID=UPI0035DEC2C2